MKITQKKKRFQKRKKTLSNYYLNNFSPVINNLKNHINLNFYCNQSYKSEIIKDISNKNKSVNFSEGIILILKLNDFPSFIKLFELIYFNLIFFDKRINNITMRIKIMIIRLRTIMKLKMKM